MDGAFPQPMKALVAGLILLTISGAALLWHFASRHKAAPIATGPERTARCMVWKVQRGKATMWLCGSIHALREEDYPLPEPYTKALTESAILVTESPHDAAGAADRTAHALAVGRLPDGEKLETKVSAATMEKVKEACETLGCRVGELQVMKPWQAGIYLANYAMQQEGFRPSLGLESRLTSTAGNRTLASLETLEAQLGAIDSLDTATQETMLARAAEEVKSAESHLKAQTDAWREGDTRALLARSEKELASLPAVKKALLDDRHAAWLPQLEKYLDGTETVMVLVGVRHLCGPDGLVEMLAAKGAAVTQMEYRTTRVAP